MRLNPTKIFSLLIILFGFFVLTKTNKTDKVFAIDNSCFENGINLSNKEGWGLEGVWLYRNNNYNKTTVEPCSFFSFTQRGAGSWTNYAPYWNVGNDTVSSIRIVGSFKVRIYEHDQDNNGNFVGKSLQIDTGWQNEYYTEIDLVSKTINGVPYTDALNGFDEVISAIEIETVSNCNNHYGNQTEEGVYFFQNPNYNNGNMFYDSNNRCTLMPMRRSFVTRGRDFFQATNMWNWYLGNDAVTSYKFKSNSSETTAVMYTDYDAKGTAVIDKDDSAESMLSGYDNTTSSISISRFKFAGDTDDYKYQTMFGGFTTPKVVSNILYKKDQSVYDKDFSGIVNNGLNVFRNNSGNSFIYNSTTGDNWNILFKVKDRSPKSTLTKKITGFADPINVYGDGNEGLYNYDKVEITVYKEDMRNFGTFNLTYWSDEERTCNQIHEMGHVMMMLHIEDGDTVMKQGKYSCSDLSRSDRERFRIRSGRFRD